MSKFIKLCACGTQNRTTANRCSSCKRDISLLDFIDIEESAPEVAENKVDENEVLIRVCDECGHKNPVNLRKCENCGEDINHISPTIDTCVNTTRYILSSVDDTYAFEMLEEKYVIGRENSMQEYLKDKMFVSRMHAELYIDNNLLYVKNLSDKNRTYLNNELISQSEPVELKDGDELGLGGNEQNGSRQDMAAYFIVRIGENCQ